MKTVAGFIENINTVNVARCCTIGCDNGILSERLSNGLIEVLILVEKTLIVKKYKTPAAMMNETLLITTPLINEIV